MSPNKPKRTISRKKIIWIAVLVAILASAGGYAYYQFGYLPASSTVEQPTLQTATVRRGDLILYASGTGTLIPAAEATFGFGTSGQVTDIFVQVGERVDVGQVLAQIDDAAARYNTIEANRNLLELTSPAAVARSQQAVAQAEANLSSTRNTLAWLISPTVLHWEEKVAEAQQALVLAQAEAGTEPTESARQKVSEAETSLARADASLRYAQQLYTSDYLADTFTETEIDRRTGQEVIVYYTDETTGEEYPVINAPTAYQITTARADYALAQATLQEARWYLAALNGEEIPANATGNDLSKVEQARINYENALLALEATQLVTPISGTVMEINFDIGDTVGGSGMTVTIADLSQAYLEVFLDETDWDKVAVGYAVEVTFDVVPDKVYTGLVVQVDPGLSNQGNTSLVRAVVALDPLQTGLRLPVGAGAAVDVIGGRAINAILVPVEALREVSPGEYAVFVIEAGEPRVRIVEVGISDLFYAEILSGLEPGDVVTTGLVETE